MQDEEDHLYAIRIHNSSTKIDYDNRKKSHYSFAEEEATSVHAKKTTANERRKNHKRNMGEFQEFVFELAQKVFQLNKLMPAATF